MNLTLIYTTAVVMLVIGLGFIYMLIGYGGWRKPKDGMEWLGTIVSGGVAVMAIVLFFMAFRVQQAEEAIFVQGRSEIEDYAIEEPAANFPFQLVDTDGNTDLDAYRGKVILLNFWATWCAPCLVEIPQLNDLANDYEDEGLVVLSISDEPRELLQAFEQQLPLETVSAYIDPVNPLPGVFERALQVRPTTFIIDREGTVRRYILGDRSYSFFRRAIQPYL